MFFFFFFVFLHVVGAVALTIVAPKNGELVVSDRLLVSAVFDHHFSPPPAQHRVCLQLDSEPPRCWSDYGPLGSKRAGVFCVFLDVPDDSGAVRLLRAWIPATEDESMLAAETSGNIARTHFRRLSVDECGRENHHPQRRRVFDVFPFFGRHEVELAEVRTHELRDVVDIFVPVQATLTHSGLPKRLEWNASVAADATASFVADLSNVEPHESWAAATGDLNLAREEKQRDAATEALRAAGAEPSDLVIIADADEIADQKRIATLRSCAAFLDANLESLDAVLPAVLDMTWFVYSLNWRARHRWGLFAREGAVVVTAAMLGLRTATAWRRQFRERRLLLDDHSAPRARLLLGAGWHMSSFGGQAAVAEKLKSYIGVSEYGSSFYRDEDRLNRLLRAGVAYYELAGLPRDHHHQGHRLLECVEYEDDPAMMKGLPAYVALHARGRLRSLFSDHECDPTTQHLVVDADVFAARTEAATEGHFVLGGWSSTDLPKNQQRVFEPHVTCQDDGQGFVDASLRAHLQAQCDASGLTLDACDQVWPMLERQCDAELNATRLMRRKDSPATLKINISTSIVFQETVSIPITVDNEQIHIVLSAYDDVEVVTKAACLQHRLPFDQCHSLEGALKAMQPKHAWFCC
ncbi:hypothetical protein CTAYLR_007802 [Chrysophaeum taylorii]|uniref:Uncharacterized protein n=1 Tax=Chrysophaeum taylorii TaxID=2483200 RepID=A0AAD7UJ12_9STRA|nr:hypothetical protein CTAYLR_007802 [Chrysophaeum taylorii]